MIIWAFGSTDPQDLRKARQRPITGNRPAWPGRNFHLTICHRLLFFQVAWSLARVRIVVAVRRLVHHAFVGRGLVKTVSRGGRCPPCFSGGQRSLISTWRQDQFAPLLTLNSLCPGSSAKVVCDECGNDSVGGPPGQKPAGNLLDQWHFRLGSGAAPEFCLLPRSVYSCHFAICGQPPSGLIRVNPG